jgi:hypothetical protein
MKYFKETAMSLTLLSSMFAEAAYNQSIHSEITFIAAYGRSSAPGDVLIKLKNPHADCVDGYYSLADSPNKDAILSIALSAYHAKTKVKINGFDEPNWRGSSSSNTCEIEGINVIN